MPHRQLPHPISAFILVLLMLATIGTARLATAESGPRGPWWGKVQHVSDGDTVWLMRANAQAVKVRLAGFDAPEICQHWGQEARQALASVLVTGRWVQVWPQGKDVYERLVAGVWVNGQDLAAWMVFHGHAWADPKNPRLMALQHDAQIQGRGLFASPAALPKVFRQWRGPCHGA